MGNFSRLLIDPGKPLTDASLIRTSYRAPDNNIAVSFNASGYRLFERLETFYLEYHKLLKESLDFLEPTCILNIHSHDPELSPTLGSDVVVYNPSGLSSPLIRALSEKKELKVKILDRLTTHNTELCSPMIFDQMICNREGRTLDGAYISVNSSRMLFEPEWTLEVSKAITQAVRDTHLLW